MTDIDSHEAIRLLHSAARHYCASRATGWSQRYSVLVSENRHRTTIRAGNWTYTEESYGLFPRYQVLYAILDDIERFIPGDFGSLDEAKSLLSIAGETAQSPFTRGSEGTVIRAMNEERKAFVEFIVAFDPAFAPPMPPMPFRRVLGEAEHNHLHKAFIDQWGKWYGGGVAAENARDDVITLHVLAMEQGGSYAALRRAIQSCGIPRILELREFDSSYEIDTDTATFTYNGAEGFWTVGEMQWMVYASHEASITFGGAWLIEEMKEHIPHFERYIYRGWDLSAYDLPKPA